MNEDLKIYIKLIDILKRRINADPSIQGEMLAKMTRTIELLRRDILESATD